MGGKIKKVALLTIIGTKEPSSNTEKSSI